SVAAGASILAGIAALTLSLRQPAAHSAAYCQGSSESPPPRRGRARVGVKARRQVERLRLVAAGTGALGLGLEVLWTRLFAQVLHNSVYSFTAIALVFLVALALGAVVAALLLQRVAPAALASVALVTAAVTTVGGLWLFVHWTDGLAYVGMQSG